MAWLMRRPSASRAELGAARPREGSPVAQQPAFAWGILIPEGPTATGLLAEQYPMVTRTVHVGRTVNPLCALCLPLPQVSCSHLSIASAGPGTYLLTDDSTNGTWVDGVRAPRGCPMALRSGCRVVLCAPDLGSDKAVGFRFVVLGPNGEQPALSPLPPAALPAAPLSSDAALAAASAGSAAWRPDDGEAPATQCAVCWNAHVRVLLLPCAHLCICAACDAGLARRVCPLCREPISATINARFP